MAKYISNWYGAYPSVTGSDIATGIINLTNSANNLYSVTYYGIAGLYDYTPTYISGYFYDGSDFAMYGSGFYTYLPTITELDIFASDGYKYLYAGSIKYNVITDVQSGALNHIAIESPAGEKFDLYGNINVAGTTATITKISYQYTDGTIIFSGSLNYNNLYGTISGNITSYQFIDSFGHSYTISNFSIPFSQLDLYSNLDSFVADVMAGNDNIVGTAAADVILGYAGNDILDGVAGADTLVGGAGDDTFIVDNIGDVVIENPNEGTDLVKVSIATAGGTYTLTDNVENATLTNTVAYNLTGNTLNNVLTGNAAVNTLTGGDGNDTLDGGAGIDSLNGGNGNDTYIVDVAGDLITDSSGTDTVIAKLAAGTYTLAAGLEHLTLSGTAAINGTGNADNNTITGNTAANILNGAGGTDTLIGGDGADTYVVDSTDDTVTESNGLAAGGIDVVQSSVDWTLGANLEKLTLTGSGNINGTGNALANTLTGNTGNNILDGGVGVDTLAGGLGNDTYLVDLTAAGALQDTVTEAAGGGTDTIRLRGTSTNVAAAALTLGANLENLDASDTGLSKLNLTGNTLANSLSGNAADNILDGGTGIDTLAGGLGNDTYVVDNALDIVTEALSEGDADLVKVSIATAGGTYTLTDNVENATLTNTVAYNLTGNTLNNVLTGNAAVNTLTGGDGNDTLDGGAGIDSLNGGNGNDTYIVDVAGDLITDSSGTDTVIAKLAAGTYTLAAGLEHLTLSGTAAINGTGNADNNTITGNTAANILNGAGGTDTLIGGDGADTYVVDSTDDTVTESNGLAAGGIDVVQSSVDWTLGANLEKLTLTGSGNINGTGNALANTLTGNTGNNILDGGVGVDTLAGGLGNDTYLVDLTAAGALQDTVTEAAGGGTDTIRLRGTSTNVAAAALTLGANLENLDASDTGLSKLNLTGNTLANSLSGNAADNILDGGTGIDTLAGGLGNDTYVVDNALDIVTEALSEGDADLVKVSIATAGGTYTLTDNVENATLTNTVAYNLTGNTLNNVLTGNAAVNTLTGGDGNDTLDGGAGIDSLNGGNGNDTYIVDVAGDLITDSSGTDTVIAKLAAGTYTLAAGLEHLTLSGTAAINGTGNADNNTITGNTAANILNGAGGTDTLIGGDGADTYVVDSTDDTVTESNGLAAGGIDVVQSSVDWTLGANLEKLTLTGSGNINGTGNALANTLTGNTGNNILDGGVGVDTLAGGLGNDTYLVDLTAAGALQDTVTEAAGGGTDTVELRGSFNQSAIVLLTGVNIENLDASATGTSKLILAGNALNNTLTGNDWDNALEGKTGNDILIGGIGYDYLDGGDGEDMLIGGADGDTLDGGAGVDTLIGGTGEDNYLVDLVASGTGAGMVVNLQDTIIESDNEGNYDNVTLRGTFALTNAYTIALTGSLANLEGLDISRTGTTKLNLTGNDGNNVLKGNAADNIFDGGLGDDLLDGGAGADTLIGGAGQDSYNLDLKVTGTGASANVNTFDDTIIESTDIVAGGYDFIHLTGSAALTNATTLALAGNWAGIESLDARATGTTKLNLTGNDAVNNLFGNDAENILDGGGESDHLDGGTGNDTLIGGSGSDGLRGGLGADIFKWELSDKGTAGTASVDTISDFSLPQNDVLDLRDLLQGESSSSGNLLNYLDITTNSGNTEIRISSNGSFASGNYSAGNEDARIVLTGLDLFGATGTSNETDLIQNLITSSKLIVD